MQLTLMYKAQLHIIAFITFLITCLLWQFKNVFSATIFSSGTLKKYAENPSSQKNQYFMELAGSSRLMGCPPATFPKLKALPEGNIYK